MFFITDPGRFDVVVTDNLFGDIFTDLAAAVSGGIGLAASGNLDVSGHQPEHVRAGARLGARTSPAQGIADPTATVLSVALLLDHLGPPEQATGRGRGRLRPGHPAERPGAHDRRRRPARPPSPRS